MQQKAFERQIRMEDDILELARLVSESIVAAATAVAEALLEATTVLG